MSLHYSNSSNNKMLSIKVLLISTSVLSMAMMLKLSMQVIMEFTISDLPSILNFLNSWLRPPYLYLIINCIIITIVASSRLQSNKVEFDHPLLLPETAMVLHQPEPVKLIPHVHVPAAVYDSVVPTVELKPEIGSDCGVKVPEPDLYVTEDDIHAAAVYDSVEPTVELKPEIESDYGVKVPEPDLYVTEDDIPVPETIAVNALEEMKTVNEFMFSKPVRSIPKNGLTIPREKPPVSSRFGHRKSIKASPEGGRTLGVTKPKKQDTLESTWKTITEGRPMPLTRHLKKSDTWETDGRHHTTSTSQMTKSESETFNVSNPPPSLVSNPLPPSLSLSTGSGKLKKDLSLGQEELNKKVEAFIKKINEDMRLQRQESLNQYMEMINRGAH